jgi:hypothetical protein
MKLGQPKFVEVVPNAPNAPKYCKACVRQRLYTKNYQALCYDCVEFNETSGMKDNNTQEGEISAVRKVL